MAYSAFGQSVYKCIGSDGVTSFSDVPCESDIGEESIIDVTPYQGHRSGEGSSTRPYVTPGSNSDLLETVPRNGNKTSQREPRGSIQYKRISRSERMSLERQRKMALANLRKRHLPSGERRQYLAELADADRRLGITASDIQAMPVYDRRVYENYAQGPSSATNPSRGYSGTEWDQRIDPITGEVFIGTGPASYIGTRSGDQWINEGAHLRNTRTNETKQTVDN